MKHPLMVKTPDGEKILISEDHVCSVRPFPINGTMAAKIIMSNGEEIIDISHPFVQWENDLLRQLS